MLEDHSSASGLLLLSCQAIEFLLEALVGLDAAVFLLYERLGLAVGESLLLHQEGDDYRWTAGDTGLAVHEHVVFG